MYPSTRDGLFKVNDKHPVKLNAEDKIVLHINTARLLFLGKRARPDIQTGVSFICTRVKDPDEDD